MQTNITHKLSIILPARNEAKNLVSLLPSLRKRYPDAEILVVDDGSTDNTREVCEAFHVHVLSNANGMGNGAAVKKGARHAKGEILVFMDADGQHPTEGIGKLLDRFNHGLDMVVGARSDASQAGTRRRIGNRCYNRLASLITGHRIADLTSGFRVVKADKFREFIPILPNGFSYPTTITMAFFRSGYAIDYLPIHAGQRIGNSHIRILRDGIRFLIIIFRVGTLYSPLKVFVPISALFFVLGLGYYIYTFLLEHRFTNMSALLFSTSLIIFLMGLISEQITNLLYSQTSKH
jgi:glycosyltransferase involved in cell wall biosynthesis